MYKMSARFECETVICILGRSVLRISRPKARVVSAEQEYSYHIYEYIRVIEFGNVIDSYVETIYKGRWNRKKKRCHDRACTNARLLRMKTATRWHLLKKSSLFNILSCCL